MIQVSSLFGTASVVIDVSEATFPTITPISVGVRTKRDKKRKRERKRDREREKRICITQVFLVCCFVG